MHSNDVTPRFRNSSVNYSVAGGGTPRFSSSSMLFQDKDQEERRDPEKECFMCRQANIYVKPIGMQQERRVGRRHPPPLTRAQIEELSQKKSLTKREARLLLQCFFPEIKNVKYFQLHRYHSCCYDPKHLNLCKNHITALQHEREKYHGPGGHHHHHHHHDDDQYKDYEREGASNRVSFVRIKIEPTNGIPTRFLGPAALPESLANMLIKQVNRFEEKKKPIAFESKTPNPAPPYQVRRVEQTSHGVEVSRLSEYLSRISSDEDEDDNEGKLTDVNAANANLNSRQSQIRGFEGKVMDHSRLQYETSLYTKEEKKKPPTHRINGDLVVEDIDELGPYFANGRADEGKNGENSFMVKKRKRVRRRRVRHRKPKLNHWEIKALEQAKQEVCGCRHHVRRLEADQVIYDWCRCKDHQHRDLKLKPKPIPPPPPPPAPKIEKKTVGLDAMPTPSHEIAVAYDPSDVDYKVIQEVLYYRTASGRLVKPEIRTSFPDNVLTSNGKRSKKKTSGGQSEAFFTARQGTTGFVSDSNSNTDLASLMIVNSDGTIYGQHPDRFKGTEKVSKSLSKMTIDEGKEGTGEDEDEESETATDSDEEIENFSPPKFIPDEAIKTPTSSPSIPFSMQKSSKPSYSNSRPTPNFERESSILASRRWFDQPLGDQNLRPVHDGRYGLIAGTTTEQFQFNTSLPDNDYVEPYNPARNKGGCTIS